MFAKLARFNGFGRRHALLSAAKTAYANDNQPVRRSTAAAPRARRQVLACGWRQVPATGRLECFWQVEPAGAAAAEEPGISRLLSQVKWRPAIAAAVSAFVTVEHIAKCSLGYTL